MSPDENFARERDLDRVEANLTQRINVHRNELDRHGDKLDAIDTAADNRLTQIENTLTRVETILAAQQGLIGRLVGAVVAGTVTLVGTAIAIILFGGP